MSEFPALTPTGEEPSMHNPANMRKTTEVEVNDRAADHGATASRISRCLQADGDRACDSRASITATSRASVDADAVPPSLVADRRLGDGAESQYESECGWLPECILTVRESSLPTRSVWSESGKSDFTEGNPALGFHARALSVISQRAISLYTEPGEIVFDPQCSSPIIVGEASRQRRNAIGVTEDANSAARIARRLNEETASWTKFRTIKSAISQPVRNGRQEPIPIKAFATLAILTARAALQKVADGNSAYNPRHGEPAPHREFLASLRECRRALRPDGIVIVYAPRQRMSDELVDIPGMAIAALHKTGFTPIDRIAVTVPLPHGSQPTPASDASHSPFRSTPRRRRRAMHQRIHEDLIVARVN